MVLLISKGVTLTDLIRKTAGICFKLLVVSEVRVIAGWRDYKSQMSDSCFHCLAACIHAW